MKTFFNYNEIKVFNLSKCQITNLRSHRDIARDLDHKIDSLLISLFIHLSLNDLKVIKSSKCLNFR